MNEESRKALEDYMRACVCACIGKPSDFIEGTVEVALSVCDETRMVNFIIIADEPLDRFNLVILERMLEDLGFGKLVDNDGHRTTFSAEAYVGDFVEQTGRFWDFAKEIYKQITKRSIVRIEETQTSRVAPVRVTSDDQQS